MTRHYLDHASTSPLRPAALDALTSALGLVADPGRIHQEALTARHAVEVARQQVADLLGARSREVVFTSGATESIAMACHGAARRDSEGRRTRSVLAAVEHSAVRHCADREGPTTVVGVDRAGRVDPDELLTAVGEDTAIVHLQWGNHEVGTCHDLEPVIAACRERDVLVHVDAAQAVGRVPVDFRALGADLLSVSAHKFGGPPGVGALLVRRGLRLEPLLLGGDQERARRAGLENVPAVVGFGAACEALGGGVLADEEAESRRLTDRLAGGTAALDGIERYGDPDRRLPHLVCVGITDIEPQAVLLGLDRAGVAAHSGSACASEGLEPSPVLEAMGVDAHRSLRLSVGWNTTDADVDAAIDALPGILAGLRALR
ncbi:MAG: cysteine desulfurase [Actinobacteria bacterium]|nr:cysteine desulfurase [Actinomycetota bacterium]